MIEMPDRITGAWLNSLSIEQRIEISRSPFGRRLHEWAASHVTYFRWAAQWTLGRSIANGSVFFLDLGGTLLAVTAAHVLHGFLKTKRQARRVLCHIENVEFDPETRLRGECAGIDIATFNFDYDDLKKIGKQALVADRSSWPPVHAFSGQAAILAGFPGVSRLWINRRSISFGLFTALLPVNVAADDKLTCPFDREHWVDDAGHKLPPSGYELGGISGGPLLLPMEREGEWNFQLGGVMSQAPASVDYQTVVAVPAHFITTDGKIDPKSAPVRFAVPASTGDHQSQPSVPLS